MIARPWAFWRRVQYGSAFSVLLIILMYFGYNAFFYAAPTCFDGKQNASERGVDCGGACMKVCSSDAIAPNIQWARSFKVTDGQYNAVAYVENRNEAAAAPEITYTFSLYDDQGLITEKSGTSFLPPDSVYPIFEGRITTGGRIPTKTFLDVQPITNWVIASAGRDQFSIANRDLKEADTRPRLNATVVNNALTLADNVEVVATIFDARGNALTASRTFIEKFSPRAQEQVVFTWPEPIAKTIRSCEVPTDVVMAIDLSGSMNNDGGTPPEPISSVLKAAESFASRLRERDQAAVITFATEALVVEKFTAAATAADTIRTLSILPAEETGSTNTGEAFLRAKELFSGADKNPDARKVMVILTDGLATAPDEEPEQYALAKAAELKREGVEVYAIGLGQQVNMDFVRQLASDNHAYQALSSSQVDGIYKDITGAICEDGAAIIEIIPKIPLIISL